LSYKGLFFEKTPSFSQKYPRDTLKIAST